MKLPEYFYVVTRKSYKGDTIGDLLSKSNLQGLSLRFIGGLEAKEVIGIFTTRKEALPFAQKEKKSKTLYKRNQWTIL